MLMALQVCGDNNSLDLIKQTRPSVVVPFMNAEMQVGFCKHASAATEDIKAP